MRLQAFEVRSDRFPDVLDSFFPGLSLRDAAGQGRHFRHVHAVLVLLDQNSIFHTLTPLLWREAKLRQLWMLKFATQLFDLFETVLNIEVESLAVIPVVRERRMDLPERQVRVLEAQLSGAPSISLLLGYQLHDLHRRVGDARDTILVQHYMFVACLLGTPHGY